MRKPALRTPAACDESIPRNLRAASASRCKIIASVNRRHCRCRRRGPPRRRNHISFFLHLRRVQRRDVDAIESRDRYRCRRARWLADVAGRQSLRGTEALPQVPLGYSLRCLLGRHLSKVLSARAKCFRQGRNTCQVNLINIGYLLSRCYPPRISKKISIGLRDELDPKKSRFEP